MEAILENLSMDATAGKLKAITDACDEGLGKCVVSSIFVKKSLSLLTLFVVYHFRGFIS